MKKRFIYILLFVMVLFPINALAFNSNDDNTVKVNQSCERRVAQFDSHGNVSGATVLKFNLYNNGKKEVCVEGICYENGNVDLNNSTLGNFKLRTDLDSVFKQTEKQIKKNKFTCPENVYYETYKSGNTSNIYITANKEDAEEFAKTGNFSSTSESGTNSSGGTSIENTVVGKCESKEIYTDYSSSSTPFSTEYEFRKYSDGSMKVCYKNGNNFTCINNGAKVKVGDKELPLLAYDLFPEDTNSKVYSCSWDIYEVISEEWILLTQNREDAENSANTGKLPDPTDDGIFSNKDDSKPNLGEEVEGCEVVPDVIRKWIKVALNFVKYVALILVVVLGTLDFIKAAGSGEPDGMKKAGQAFLKRIIAVIILFLLPMLIELILNLINLYGSTGDCFGVLE